MNLDPPKQKTVKKKQTPKKLPSPTPASVEFDLILDMQMADILGDTHGFKASVIRDLAHAVDGLPHKMQIFGLEAGSVIVNIAFDQDVCGGMRSALDVLRDLERQAGDPMSKLRQGRYTCHANSLL